MAFYDTPNQYRRTTIVIDTFDDGTHVLREHTSEYVSPPCSKGPGCRAASTFEQEHCEFDPKTGYCGGRMP